MIGLHRIGCQTGGAHHLGILHCVFMAVYLHCPDRLHDTLESWQVQAIFAGFCGSEMNGT
jgi:hypothetical protein